MYRTQFFNVIFMVVVEFMLIKRAFTKKFLPQKHFS